ncbi:unnamed protein product [Fraxinus pennsylvanica]|uniref:Cytochrome P450 n=1 Tax=Fraxinus pennsylvanica TaxID=56036 RepID=A0AAD1Z385_9LAMI|nr:unnamed protein product [Fraxinus pennsylvanica]
MDTNTLNNSLISIFAAILAICTVKKILGSSRKEKKKYHPIARTMLHQLLNFRRLLSLNNSEVYTADPAVVEYVLKTNFVNHGKAGPRICLGKEFAYWQMKIYAAVLLGVFSFKLNDEKKAVKYRTMLTLQINGGLHLRAVHRFGC